jgi:hypothetical protein
MGALLADKGYDGDGLRAEIIKIGAKDKSAESSGVNKSAKVVLVRAWIHLVGSLTAAK